MEGIDVLHQKIMEKLQQVKDPEIDSVSMIELGMLERIELTGNDVRIEVLPTFMGCPALEIIKKNILSAVKEIDEVGFVAVEFSYSVPWTSDRISEAGREKLKEFGIAPPPEYDAEGDGMWKVNCPYCASAYTTMENLFGPTACRSILYCKACKNPFEAMKPISTLM
ncbi:1,2-phenylacetyl-CoA epoxidase subunit PaaD [Falsibacillus albus]|uniref:Phenylacetate-CoA oxygenase subunit PaaJ n=1 Tax=Falsibacillus albus TaxID=2478915 RepID=A0A3L7K3L2_9BACI|nr:1,2-phenylacetyl-CoA epoxidase subunit PaaD [Falsibacillus albus]RLQ97420.1 phenylacetate-CoA oxygenase subunit PaaJ [Falsibacillus albus]